MLDFANQRSYGRPQTSVSAPVFLSRRAPGLCDLHGVLPYWPEWARVSHQPPPGRAPLTRFPGHRCPRAQGEQKLPASSAWLESLGLWPTRHFHNPSGDPGSRQGGQAAPGHHFPACPGLSQSGFSRRLASPAPGTSPRQAAAALTQPGTTPQGLPLTTLRSAEAPPSLSPCRPS